MPVMKQKSIQPARGVPYAEGILMYNNTAGVIPANTLVKVEASPPTGASLNMTNLLVNAAAPANGAVPRSTPFLLENTGSFSLGQFLLG